MKRAKLFEIIYRDYQKREDKWIETFNIIKDYIASHNKPITQKTEYKGYKIGAWLNQNKVKYHKGKLPKNREKLLRQICDLDSYWDKKWEEKYNLLKEYVDFGGKVDTKFVYKDVNLGWWYSSQFTLYNNGNLSSDRVSKLKLLGLLESQKEKMWEDFILLLKDYFRTNTNIVYQTIYKENKIGSKLGDCRKRYKQGKFPEERYQQLLSLGIDLAKEGSFMADPA